MLKVIGCSEGGLRHVFCVFFSECPEEYKLRYLDPLEEQDEVFKNIQQQIKPLMKRHQAHLLMKPTSHTDTPSAVINSAVIFTLNTYVHNSLDSVCIDLTDL